MRRATDNFGIEGFDPYTDIENIHGVSFGDIFYLVYYGICIFFYVCCSDHHQVAIYELAKKRIKHPTLGKTIEMLTEDLKPTKSPYVVLENNCWTKSCFLVKTAEGGRIIIPVEAGSRLYNKAIQLGVEFPDTGEFYAEKLDTKNKAPLEYYCDIPKNKKLIN